MTTTIYTIGHGSREFEEFCSLLKRWDIQLLIDIRRWPTSKTEWFRQRNLEKLLMDMGIQYLWLGESLGGFRKGGYPNYMGTEQFVRGYSYLLVRASQKTCAMMCLEISPRGCHRRFISSRLAAEGWTVIHIISEARVQSHQDLFAEGQRPWLEAS
jgi:uncharacterized protein (DUF488 family)